MEELTFSEVIETSSQKSLLTGNPGFGVRTFTEGLSREDVDNIYRELGANYELPMQRKVNVNALRENPDVVLSYPMTYRYKRVQTLNGEVLNALTRTVYIGIDYGFFCNKDSALRAGDNYLSHTLFTESDFSSSMLSLFGQEGVFLPVNRSSSPDNSEYQKLLTGEPVAMPGRQFVLEENRQIDELTGKLAIVLLQARFNKDLGKEESLSQVVVKSADAKVLGLIGRMASLPDELVCPMTFQTNYMQGGGVPTGYNMVFVNEYNQEEIFESGYVVFDVERKTMGNVDSNYCFDRIVEFARSGEYTLMTSLVNCLLSLKVTETTDYRFVYNLFKITDTSLDLTLEDLSKEFFDKLAQNCLTDKERLDILHTKVTEVINRLLSHGTEQEFRRVLDLCHFLFTKYPHMLTIEKNTLYDITERVFSEKHTFAGLIASYGPDFVQSVITVEAGLEQFMAAMTEIADITLWKKFIAFYFSDTQDLNLTVIVDHALQSVVSDKHGLVMALYPMERYRQQILGYLFAHPECYDVLSACVRDICLPVSNIQDFNRLVAEFFQSAEYSQKSISVLVPVIGDYYREQVRSNMVNSIEQLVDWAESLPPGFFAKIGLDSVFNEFSVYATTHPKEVKSLLITRLEEVATVGRDAMSRLNVVRCLADKELNDLSHVGLFELVVAKRMAMDDDSMLALYSRYLKEGPANDKLKKALADEGKPSHELARRIIQTAWNSVSHTEDRERIILCLIDTMKWGRKEREDFIKSCTDAALVQTVRVNYSFMKTIIRKLFRR